MKKGNAIKLGLLALLMAISVGCAKDDVGGVSLTSGESVELPSVTNQTKDVTFYAGESWTASCNASWLTFSPKSGEQGANAISLTTTATNRTKKVRTATLTIASGGKKRTISVRQRDEYAVFEKDVYEMPAEGGELTMNLSTNVEQGKLYWGWSLDLEEIVPSLKDMKDADEARTRADYKLGPMQTVPNTSRYRRSGYIFLSTKTNDGSDLLLDTVTVSQEGMYDGYFSVDYSKDGEVNVLQQASVGKGIPIVVMGDGFQDREIADGSYAEVMNQAVENLFSEEPVRSLRDYFTVYQVTAVSRNNQFGDNYQTALSTLPDPGVSTGIDADAGAVMKYVKRVEGIDSIHTLAVVILNTNEHKGVTFMMGDPKRHDYSYAIALCPVIDSLKSEQFRRVLTHEAIGHGFAKLADEYVRSTEGSATDKDIRELKAWQETYGWHLNVDSESDSTKVLWSQFIFDEAYEAEKIGTYEGGYTFYKGVWRPSEESMMRSNDAPFNAPSRQAIYNRVMRLALGTTPTYEEFKAFDRAHQPASWSYDARTRQSGETTWRPAPPRIIWRDR